MYQRSKRKPSKIRNAAAVKLGLGTHGLKVRDLSARVAEHLGVPMPFLKSEQWALLYQFVGVPLQPMKHRPSRHRVAEVATNAFLLTYEWRRLRMVVLTKRGAVCECCGASPKTGAVINVDHVKPRRLFPELALTESNLQVLCGPCNHGKGNWDQTDWREDQPAQPVTEVEDFEPMWTRPRLVKKS